MVEKIILTKVLVVRNNLEAEMDPQAPLPILSKDCTSHTPSKLFYKGQTLCVQQTTLIGLLGVGVGGGEQRLGVG